MGIPWVKMPGPWRQAQQLLPLSRCLVLSKLGGVEELTPEKLENRRKQRRAGSFNGDLMVIRDDSW